MRLARTRIALLTGVATLGLAALVEYRGAEAGTPSVPPPGLLERGGPNWSKVYPEAAPAVVFITGGQAPGVGFLVDWDQGEKGEGWLLTNDHLVEGCPTDAQRQCILQAAVGTLGRNNVMVPTQPTIPVVVYSRDPTRDLALLRIDDIASTPLVAARPLEFGRKSRFKPNIGLEVALIGADSLGQFWKLKSGTIESMGRIGDNPEVRALYEPERYQGTSQLDEVGRRKLEALLAAHGKEAVYDVQLLQNNIPAELTDSGAPLLNEKGQVIGIASIMPSPIQTQSLALGAPVRFYVHEDDIAAMLAEPRTDRPHLEILHDFWTIPVARYQLVDFAGAPSSLLQGLDDDGHIIVEALDLDDDLGLGAQATPKPVEEPVLATFADDNGTRFVSVHALGKVYANDRGNQALWSLDLGGPVYTATANASGSRLYVAHASPAAPDATVVSVIGLENGSTITSFAVDAPKPVAIAAGPGDDSVWYSDSVQGGLVLFDGNGVKIHQPTLPGSVTSIASTSGGDLIGATLANGRVLLYDKNTEKVVWSKTLTGMAVEFGPTEQFLAATSRTSPGKSKVTWFRVSDGKEVHSLPAEGDVYAISTAPDAKQYAIETFKDGKGWIQILDAKSGAILASRERDAEDPGHRALRDLGLDANSLQSFAFTRQGVFYGSNGGTLYRVLPPGAGAIDASFRNSYIEVDLAAVVEDRSFDAEFALVTTRDPAAYHAMYDRDNDPAGSFEIVRVLEPMGTDPQVYQYFTYGRTAVPDLQNPDRKHLLLQLQYFPLPPAAAARYQEFVQKHSG